MGSRHRNRPLDAIDLHVAARLRGRRRELQLDPGMLDLMIGESAGTVLRFESAERRISAAHLFRLGQALNVDIPYFFAEDATEGADAADEPPHAAPQVVAEGERLVRMFRRLPDRNLRGLVLRLIKSIATRQYNSR